jgi:hypothetical protein
VKKVSSYQLSQYRLTTIGVVEAIVMITMIVMVVVAFVVRIALAVARPPMFATIARIDDAFRSWLRRASTMLARIVVQWAFEFVRAMMRAFMFDDHQSLSWAVIFTIGHQWTMIAGAFRLGHADAFLARSQLRSDGVARIGDASILLARAFGAWTMMTFGQTTFANTTRIGTAVRFTTFAIQTWTWAFVGAVFPFVFAAMRWSR